MDDLKLGVVGAGVMGSGIAQTLAQSGYDTVCCDVVEDVLEKARSEVVSGRYGLDRAVERGKLTRDEADAAASRHATFSASDASSAQSALSNADDDPADADDTANDSSERTSSTRSRDASLARAADASAADATSKTAADRASDADMRDSASDNDAE